MPTLSVDSGPDKGMRAVLSDQQGMLLAGRVKESHLQLTDTLISSKHFRVEKKGGALSITDLKSTNGVFVNDARITETMPLKVGDVIMVGETYISVLEDEEKGRKKEQAKKEIAGFALQKRIGVGGMGVVYRAVQISLDRTVALKILAPKLTRDPKAVKQFISEARAAGQLTHANVVQVHDVGMEDAICYICMEYVGGGSLSDILREQGRLDTDTALKVGMDIARGLQFAETRGIVHADIKPDNVLITESGVAKIADLGLSQKSGDKGGEDGEATGSPHYMSPEQARGAPLDHRTDQYSLGCTLYRAVSGRTPFTGTSPREIMRKQVQDEAPDVQRLAPEISSEFADIIHTLMEKDPDERFESAEEVLMSFEMLYDQQKTAEKKPVSGKSTGKNPKLVSAVKRAGGMRGSPGRTGSRARRSRTSQSNTWVFLPFAGVVLIFIMLLTAGVIRLSPDPAVASYSKANQLYRAGRYKEAKEELTLNGGTPDPALAKRVQDLRHNIQQQILAAQSRRNFERDWRTYTDMKASGATVDALRNKLKTLKATWHRTDFEPQIIAEIKRNG